MSGFVSLVRGFEVPLLILLLIIAVLLGIFLYRRLSKVQPAKPAPGQASASPGASQAEASLGDQPELSPAVMKTSFRNGFKTYRDAVAGSSNPYLVPWLLAVAPEGSGLSTLCAATGPARPPTQTINPDTGVSAGISWWFYDNAVMLEVASEAFVRHSGTRVADAAWTALLEELSSRRSALPLDGILLAISASDLAGPDALSQRALNDKMVQIYGRLWQAQRALGISLPVWVVITRCDIIPGFRPLAEAMPERRREEAVGWSSPYALEAAFRAEWIDEAINTVQDSLAVAALELVATNPGGEAGRAAIELPGELDRLRAPLAAALGAVFRRTAFQEALHLRGVWFTGAAGLPSSATTLTLSADTRFGEASAAPQPQAMPLAFVRDLFTQKIFVEKGLPKAAQRWGSGSARVQLAWRVGTGFAALLALFLLWQGSERLADLRAGFLPALRALEAPVRITREAERTAAQPGAAAPAIASLGAPQAIRAIGRVDVEWNQPLFPIAWLDNLKERVTVALAIGHWRLMMGDIRTRLDRRAAALAAGEADETDGPARGDLQQFRRFIGNVLLLESYVEVFNRLQATGGTDGLAELLVFTHGLRLPPSYVAVAEDMGFASLPSNRQLRSVELGDAARPLDYAGIRTTLQPRLRALSGAYIGRLANPADTASIALATQYINALAEPATARAQAPTIVTSIVDSLNRADQLLTAGGGIWLSGAGSEIGPPSYRELLRLVANSPLLGVASRDMLISDARSRLAGLTTPDAANTVIGPLTAPVRERNRIELSPAATGLRNGLATLNDRSFMRAGGTASDGELRAGLVRWDTRPLEHAVGMVGEYAIFVARDLGSLPSELQSGIRVVAQDRLVASVFDAVRRSQISQPGSVREADLQAMAGSSALAAPIFGRLAEALRQAEAPAAANQLTAAFSMQAIAVLDQAGDLLIAEQLYRANEAALRGWSSGVIDVPALFGTADIASLTAAVDRKRQRVAGLSRDIAEPILGVVARGDLPMVRASASFALWSGISTDLDAATQRRPGSAVLALESFILQELPGQQSGACRPSASRPVGTSSWFTTEHALLRAKMSQQCGVATANVARQFYQEIERAWHTHLEGRYPFNPALQANGPYATSEDIAGFYSVFDAVAPNLKEALAAVGGSSARQRPIRSFIETMEQLRPIMGALIGLPGSAEAGLFLTPQFRVLQAHENGANEVIEWRLFSGDLANNDPQRRPLTWRVGEPMRFSFRWAQNAPHVPITGGQVHRLEVRDRTVTFRYNDPWALITLITQNRPRSSEWTPGPGRPPHVLAFEVPTAMADGSPSEEPPARFFVDLALRAAPGGQGERLGFLGLPRTAPSAGLLGPERTQRPTPAAQRPAAPATPNAAGAARPAGRPPG
jgi:type VI secretion system protein ImpL